MLEASKMREHGMDRIRRPLVALLAMLALLALAVVLLRPPEAIGRELAVPIGELVEAEVVGVGQLPGHPLAVVLLRVPTAEEPVAIFVGLAEAEAIARARDGITPPRPLTHELSLGLLEASGTQVLRLVIDEMRDGAYLAAIELRLRDRRQPVWVDARPSDGLALAIRHAATILVSPQVVEAGTSMDADGSAPDATLTGREGILL
jgi:uncharacterized protein